MIIYSAPPRYLFVGGLHRSGTSLLTRMVAGHPSVGAIAGAPVPEQEGVYLQGAIPFHARHGIPGRFALDDDQHLTETSPYNRLDVKQRIEAEWGQWYPPGASWRIEKSPVNLLRARLYQALFPTSQFVFVTRHPAAACAATAKWCDDGAARLLDHWACAYERLLADIPFLHAWMIVRYEDLTADPARELNRIAAFMGLERPAPCDETLANRNGEYIRDWDWTLPLPAVATRLGYGPADAPVQGPQMAMGRHYFHSVTDRIE